jgi:hypothetical protein
MSTTRETIATGSYSWTSRSYAPAIGMVTDHYTETVTVYRADYYGNGARLYVDRAKSLGGQRIGGSSDGNAGAVLKALQDLVASGQYARPVAGVTHDGQVLYAEGDA